MKRPAHPNTSQSLILALADKEQLETMHQVSMAVPMAHSIVRRVLVEGWNLGDFHAAVIAERVGWPVTETLFKIKAERALTPKERSLWIKYAAAAATLGAAGAIGAVELLSRISP